MYLAISPVASSVICAIAGECVGDISSLVNQAGPSGEPYMHRAQFAQLSETVRYSEPAYGPAYLSGSL